VKQSMDKSYDHHRHQKLEAIFEDQEDKSIFYFLVTQIPHF